MSMKKPELLVIRRVVKKVKENRKNKSNNSDDKELKREIARQKYINWAKENYYTLRPVNTICSMCGTKLGREDLIPPEEATNYSYKYLIFSCPKCGTINAKHVE